MKKLEIQDALSTTKSSMLSLDIISDIDGSGTNLASSITIIDFNLLFGMLWD
jgi:hypothetical protein